ncbi:MAG TPA: hypothetical protein VLE49_07585 [Anaerolineales bacterium]|nr:hypothetical protein [Anaerolineales bacterium]
MEKILDRFRTGFDPAIAKLIGAALGSLAIYLLAFTVPANLLKFYQRSSLVGQYLRHAGLYGFLQISLAFISVGLLYVVGLRAAQQTSSKTAWIVVMGGTLAFITTFLFMAPVDARDIYDNIFHGRILGVYGANPFRDLISGFPHDPFFQYPWWKNSPSAYGPLWETLAGITAWLAGDGIIPNILAFKILPGIFHLASMAVVVLFLRRIQPQHALSGALLLGWNPVVLYETWGNGHNDIAMIFWVLLAALSISRKQYTLGILSLVAGTLIKFIPVLLIPAALLIGYQNLENLKSRFRFIVRTSLAGAFLIMIAYIPFWNGMATFSIGRRMQMFTTSLPALIYRILKPALGWSEAARLVSLGALGLLGIFTLIQTLRVQKQTSAKGFPQTAFNILAFYLLVTCLWFQQWYGIWLISLAPLVPAPSRRFALVFGYWVLSKQLIFVQLIIPAMSHKPETAIWLEPLLAFIVLGIPWIYALLDLRTSRRMQAAYAT